jgi:hypothetical protein
MRLAGWSGLSRNPDPLEDIPLYILHKESSLGDKADILKALKLHITVCNKHSYSNIITLLYDMGVSCHRPFFPGTSLEPAVNPTAQASSLTLLHTAVLSVLCVKFQV